MFNGEAMFSSDRIRYRALLGILPLNQIWNAIFFAFSLTKQQTTQFINLLKLQQLPMRKETNKNGLVPCAQTELQKRFTINLNY